MEVGEDQELALFQAYPCAYYVQSPSTISHANSTDDHIRNTTTLSHSSSRGSNHYLTLHHHEKKISYDARSHGTAVTTTENGDHHHNRLIIVDHNKLGHLDHDHGYDDDDDEGQEDYDYYEKRYWWKRYCSYRNSDSFGWICLQIGWRAMFSFWVALLVFYIATKPPPPVVSIKVAGVREFGLAEGVDGSGVTTKMLTCNCTINLIIHNKSKLFGLHIPPPIIQMAFGRLPFALTHGPKLYAESGTTRFELYVGTRNKPMYGAGRSMQDMLESGKGLPVVIRLSFSSNFRVFWNLVKPKFRHHAQCLLVLDKAYDKKHRTQSFNSTCTLT